MRRKRTCIVVATALFCLAGCQWKEDVVDWDEEADFRDGDLVLRCGRGVESRAVTTASRAPYSHIGLLHYDEGWMVVHVVPDEAPEGDRDTVKCEPIKEFFSPRKARQGAWMRIRCSDSVAAAAVRYALQKQQAGVAFDNDYQLSDTQRLYCTELVYQSFLHQGIDITDGRRHQALPLFCQDSVVIYPNDISDSKHTLFVKPFKTKKP
jgi:hypothetical protein